MIILGVETSCDETAAAVVQDGEKVLSSVVSSSLPSHTETGGIIPEVAARAQSNAMLPVITSALEQSSKKYVDLDALAVTYGPGLIGPLLIGVETVKTLSYVWKKSIVPVNHLVGHLYSAWLGRDNPPKFPLTALIVSGGHTELLHVKGHGAFKHLGGTRDDAAGEAFDKIARTLGLGYPGGPAIQQAAEQGNPNKFRLPRPMKNEPNFDFSFSGLKTAVVTFLARNQEKYRYDKQFIANVAASVQEAIVDVLVHKTLKAASRFNTKSVIIGGGVAANKRLRERLRSDFSGAVCVSEPKFSVDNGAMVASAAFYNYKPITWSEIKADASILF